MEAIPSTSLGNLVVYFIYLLFNLMTKYDHKVGRLLSHFDTEIDDIDCLSNLSEFVDLLI